MATLGFEPATCGFGGFMKGASGKDVELKVQFFFDIVRLLV